MTEKTEQPDSVLRHDVGMEDKAFAWVTLFRYENVPGRPRPGWLTAV
ncbi:hypothetical protein [Streptomyces sp. TLI_105]|nr:hypothetical protein [Streptomyces sp. TLI_105]